MKNLFKIRWQLVLYDLIILLGVEFVMLGLYRTYENISSTCAITQTLLTMACVFFARLFGNIYRQIWRYGGIQCYIKLLIADACAFIANYILENILPIEHITTARMIAIVSLNLLGALAIRMVYRYAYKCGDSTTPRGRMLLAILKMFAGGAIERDKSTDPKKIKIAIIGAGRTGTTLAEELLNSPQTPYQPVCFVDSNTDKIGREIFELPILGESGGIYETLKELGVQVIIFALPNLSPEEKKDIYERYLRAGYQIKVYDAPLMQNASGKRQIREFDVEELLFRKPVVMSDERTVSYYAGKTVLITGGGGSIGSELCRQLATMKPLRIIILDIYENGVYDVQQELKIAYGGAIELHIEIASITNYAALRRVFEAWRPDIVINAAAHKHVPLMEHNVIEAIENNVFGTKNLVDLCEEYRVGRFMMVSTDKAVNPTNVMGATKRMCEMIVQNAARSGNVKYSATRFGNVLGSAGSVIPLFKRQIAAGGPITLTDKRIIRYFMTIPEASQLVLQSGAMANNGELFVLDMGEPIRILDLAENMLRLAGATNIEIIETGLRPGEKLYEELLVKTEELDRTDNELIFIERDEALDDEAIAEKLSLLRSACESGSDDEARRALHIAVPTFKTPDEVNSKK